MAEFDREQLLREAFRPLVGRVGLRIGDIQKQLKKESSLPEALDALEDAGSFFEIDWDIKRGGYIFRRELETNP